VIHVTAPAPDDFNAAQLLAEMNAVHPGCVNVCGVDDQVAAIYEDDTLCPTTTEWSLVVSAHVPSGPPVDPLHVLAQAIVDASTLEDVKPVALQILTDGDT
jgi:ribulose 1,5-bisphosphate synthetase/thiazole synthase